MPDWRLYEEAYKRGLLPEDKKLLYEEAKKRGLIELPEQPNQGSNGSTGFTRDVGLGTRAVTEGVAGLPLAAGDAANQLVNYGIKGINALTGSNISEVEPASKAFEEVLDYVGLPRPKTSGEKIISGINRGASGAMSFMGAAPLAKMAGTAGEQLSSQLTYQPIQQVISGGSSGASSELAAQAGAGPVGQLAAGVAGGIVPGAVTGIPRKIVGPEKIASKIMGDKTLSNEVTQGNLERSKQLQGEIPGLNLNAAASRGDPNLLALMRSRQDVDAQKAARMNELQNTEAVSDYIVNNITGKGKPEKFQEKVQAAKNDIVKTKENALLDIEQAVGKTEPTSSLDTIGKDIRTKVTKAKTTSMKKMENLWNSIDKNVEMDSSPLVGKIDEVFGGFDEYFSRISAIPGRIAGKAKEWLTTEVDDKGNIVKIEPPKNITTGQLAEFNKQVTSDIRKARAGEDFELARNLRKLKEGINEVVSTAADSGTGIEATKLKAFWDIYKTEFVPTYRQGRTADVLAKKGRGDYSVSDIDVGGKYFSPGVKGIEGAKSFKQVFGDDPNALQLIKDNASDNLVRTLRKSPNGMIDEVAFDKWKRTYSDAIKEFGLDKEFVDLKTSLQKVGSAIAREEEFNKSILSKVLDVDSDVAIQSIMSGPNKTTNMAKVVSVIKKDTDAMDGLKASIGKWFEDRVHNFRQTIQDGTNVYSGAKIENFIRENKNILSMIYSKEEMVAFDNVLTALKKQSLESYAAKAVGSPSKELFETSMSFAKYFLPLSGKWRILDVVMGKLAAPYSKAVDGIILEAMYNPEKADRLLQMSHEIRKAKDVSSMKNTVERFVERQALLQSGMDSFRQYTEGTQE